MLDGAYGPHHGIELQVFVDLGALPHPRGIDQHELVSELVVESRDGIAGGAGKRGHDIALAAQKGIGHRRLAHVRLSDYGYMRKLRMFVIRLVILLRQDAANLVEQLACTASVGCRNAEHFAQPEGVELETVIYLLAGIDLVHAKNDGLAAAAQQVGDLLVVVGDAGLALDHKQHEV